MVNGVEATHYKSSSMWVIYTIPEVLRAVNNTCFSEKKITLKVIMTRSPMARDHRTFSSIHRLHTTLNMKKKTFSDCEHAQYIANLQNHSSLLMISLFLLETFLLLLVFNNFHILHSTKSTNLTISLLSSKLYLLNIVQQSTT